MKIVLVGTAYPLRGGIAHYNARLAAELSKRHSVRIITFKRQYPGLFFPGKSQEEVGEWHSFAPAPQWVDSVNPFNWVRVAARIRKMKPDLLIFKYWMPFFGPCFGTIAGLVKRGTDTRVLFICDNVIPHERRPGDVLFTRYAFKQVDFFIVQSDAVERDLLRLFPESVYRKVPHPVYDLFGEKKPKSEARSRVAVTQNRVVLFFGYVRAYKGLMVLLEAMSSLQRRGARDILLLVVGEFYEDESSYRERVRDLGLESQVRFVSEYVPNEEVCWYFSAADVVVLPYRSATQSGIAQIAYHFDKPVIATDVGGLAEVVLDGETGFVVPPDDPEALADAIIRFYAEEREAEFAENVRKEKRKYSWARLAEAVEELAEGERECKVQHAR